MVKQSQTGKFISLFNKSKYRDSISVNNSGNNNNRVRSNSNQLWVNYDSNNNSGNVTQGTNNGSSSSKVTQDQNKGNFNSSKWVINLSSHPLTPAQVSLLSKGPNFALVSVNPPNVEFISAVVLACQNFWTRMCRNLGLKLTSYYEGPNHLKVTSAQKKRRHSRN